MRHASRLRLVNSELVLDLLSYESLGIRDLYLCSNYTNNIESFLQSNAKTLCSLTIHNTYVTERNQGAIGYLTPAYVSSMKSLIIESQKKVNIDLCPCSSCYREGWKFIFSQDDLISVPNIRKRRRSTA
jgi:hypothetical protein